jgi:hypothetical protein
MWRSSLLIAVVARAAQLAVGADPLQLPECTLALERLQQLESAAVDAPGGPGSDSAQRRQALRAVEAQQRRTAVASRLDAGRPDGPLLPARHAAPLSIGRCGGCAQGKRPRHDGADAAQRAAAAVSASSPKRKARARWMSASTRPTCTIMARRASIRSAGDSWPSSDPAVRAAWAIVVCAMRRTGPGRLSGISRRTSRRAEVSTVAPAVCWERGADSPVASTQTVRAATTRNTLAGLPLATGEAAPCGEAPCITASGSLPLRTTTVGAAKTAGKGAENASWAASQADEGMRVSGSVRCCGRRACAGCAFPRNCIWLLHCQRLERWLLRFGGSIVA